MSEPVGTDPLDELRRVNPVDPDRLPSASLARISARIQEDTMEPSRGTTVRRRTLIPAAAGVAIAAIALVAFVGGRALGPAATPGATGATGGAAATGATGGAPATGSTGGAAATAITGGGAGLASCVERYSPETLAKRSFAFDGTVTAFSGDEVTFKIGRRFKGAEADSITLTATGMTGTAITSAGGPNLAVGERYLVAGEDAFAWACGFTQPYDATVAAQWAQATGS